MTLLNIFAAVVLAIAAPAFAINKCTGADGKIVFQDTHCMSKEEALTVKSTVGQSAAPLVDSPTASTLSVGSKKERFYGAKWRRRTDLELHLIFNARRELLDHLQECQMQQAAFAEKRVGTRAKAAGTSDAPSTSEVQAAAYLCDSRTRDLQVKLEGYERELSEFKAAK